MTVDLRVAQLRLKDFRGVRGDLTIDFDSRGDGASSLLLAGDNGSGKSSIVDGLEFVLQARIGRSQSLRKESDPEPISLASSGVASVAATLSNGDELTRSIEQVDEKFIFDRRPHASFGLSPLVLRRADILRFWDEPEASRGMVFFDYFKDSLTHPTDVTGEIEDLERRRLESKRQRRALEKQLAAAVGNPSEKVPSESANQFEKWVRKHVRKGVSSKQREGMHRAGIRVHIEPKVDALLKSIRERRRETAGLNKNLNLIAGAARERLKGEWTEYIADVIAGAEDELNRAFAAISPSTAFVDRVRIVPRELSAVSLSIQVRLRNRTSSSPRRIFSEANLDLLALLIFLAVAKETAKRDQARVLILDDVLQSVDATIRVRLMEYLLDEFKDWQLIFTVHDRLWREQLRGLLRRHGHRFVELEIVRWRFDEGPTLSVTVDRAERLRESLERGDVHQICAETGLLLEETCDVLSVELAASVTRRRGDRYTLGDLWPAVFKVLKKTSAASCADSVNTWLHLRNLVGAHYNEWAQTISRHEAESFGEAALELWRRSRCSECDRWIEQVTVGSVSRGWQCRCGATVIERSEA